MRLAELFVAYGTDKGPGGHWYHGLYESILGQRRMEVRDVLEIGIGTMIPTAHSSMVGWGLEGYQPGASLRAWRDYFPNATVVGLDPQADCMISGEDRIVTMLGDSTHPDAAAGFPNGIYDLIVDDGSHVPADQMATLRNFYRLVKPGGYYVVEDIPGGGRPVHVDNLDGIRAIVGSDPFFFAGLPAGLLVIQKLA